MTTLKLVVCGFTALQSGVKGLNILKGPSQEIKIIKMLRKGRNSPHRAVSYNKGITTVNSRQCLKGLSHKMNLAFDDMFD